MMYNYRYGILKFSKDLLLKESKEDLDWVKSVIVFVVPYQTERAKSDAYVPAKFAYGRDYHKILNDILLDFIDTSEFKLNLGQNRILVDNSFLDEKKSARLAGLGPIGKNNLVLTKDFGSRVVIGTILTSIELIPSNYILEDACLDCDRCIRACPTKALGEDGFIRSKCLSYVSQYISNEYHLYDKMILSFGCDICQNVCPINKNDYEVYEEFYYDDKSSIDLDILDKVDKNTYKDYFDDKNFSWIGYLKMLRNILVLETNRKKIDTKTIDKYQNLYTDVKWFKDHLEYLKKKAETNGN